MVSEKFGMKNAPTVRWCCAVAAAGAGEGKGEVGGRGGQGVRGGDKIALN